MKTFTYLEIREKYLNHLKKSGHEIIASASLVPENDPSLLFVNSGMFPLVPYLLGEKHPKGTRLADSQRCLRTEDIEDVGDESHGTTFEMLGNWSLNDYFKKEAINITLTFYVDEIGLDINKIYGTVFEGNEDAAPDTESIQIWKEEFKKRGIEAKVGKGEKIQEYGKKKNWWELDAGGPCGPCAEIFYDTGKPACGSDCHVNCDCGKYLELGNNVFMEYLKKEGKYSPLGRHNVDFGGGLDRLVRMNQEAESLFDTDIYLPILNKVKELSKDSIVKSQRIVVDHLKAATWIIADGVEPGRTQQSYILRRLIRRAIRHGRLLGIKDLFTREVADIAIEQFKAVHPKLESNKDKILNVLEQEEKKFNQTIENGLREFKRIGQGEGTPIEKMGEVAFKMFETYGFPFEMFIEELKEIQGTHLQNGKSWQDLTKELKEDFDKAYEQHQDKSRTASKGLFKGGLADTSEMSKKYHTATHLLLASLYDVVGSHIYQKGSNITPERLRLDFPNDAKLSDEQIKKVEALVNEKIKEALPVTFKEMAKEEALKKVKYAAFDEKYGDIVKVYFIGDPKNPFSAELCGGPHVNNTNELGVFQIVKQENVSAGIKRIKAVLK